MSERPGDPLEPKVPPGMSWVNDSGRPGTGIVAALIAVALAVLLVALAVAALSIVVATR